MQVALNSTGEIPADQGLLRIEILGPWSNNTHEVEQELRSSVRTQLEALQQGAVKVVNLPQQGEDGLQKPSFETAQAGDSSNNPHSKDPSWSTAEIEVDVAGTSGVTLNLWHGSHEPAPSPVHSSTSRKEGTEDSEASVPETPSGPHQDHTTQPDKTQASQWSDKDLEKILDDIVAQYLQVHLTAYPPYRPVFYFAFEKGYLELSAHAREARRIPIANVSVHYDSDCLVSPVSREALAYLVGYDTAVINIAVSAFKGRGFLMSEMSGEVYSLAHATDVQHFSGDVSHSVPLTLCTFNDLPFYCYSGIKPSDF